MNYDNSCERHSCNNVKLKPWCYIGITGPTGPTARLVNSSNK